MGIRIQKRAGWGLQDVVNLDPRIDWSSRAFTRKGTSGREYVHWLSPRYAEVLKDGQVRFSLDYLSLRKEAHLQRADVTECVSFDHEDESGHRVLVVRPHSCPEWYRSDDTLDYCEERLREDFGKPHVSAVRGGIFPFDGFFMDAETGEDLPYDAAIRWSQVIRAAEGRDCDEEVLELLTDDSLGELGWSYAEAKRRVVPRVPPEVRDVCEFLGLFRKDAWKELRPLVWTWWG